MDLIQFEARFAALCKSLEDAGHAIECASYSVNGLPKAGKWARRWEATVTVVRPKRWFVFDCFPTPEALLESMERQVKAKLETVAA